MSLHRSNPKRDQAEPEVVETLERLNAAVIYRLSDDSFPDLAAYFLGHGWCLLEVKTGKKKLRVNQDWNETLEEGAVLVVRDAESTVREVNAWRKTHVIDF